MTITPESSEELFIQVSRLEEALRIQISRIRGEVTQVAQNAYLEIERKLDETVDIQKSLVMEVTEDELKVLRERYVCLIKNVIHPESLYRKLNKL